MAATIATYAAFVGFLAENYEPIAWAEEIVEPARAVDHPRLAFVYVIASMCWVVGRIEAAVGYSDAGQLVIGSDCGEVPYGIQGWLGSAYHVVGQPERSVEWCRTQIACGRDTHALTRVCLVLALASTATPDEAMAAATGLIDAAEATRNPYVFSFALLAYGVAFRDADPDRALDAVRRGLVIAQDSGNRTVQTHLAHSMAVLEANSGDLLAALEYFAVAIRNLPRLGQHRQYARLSELSSPHVWIGSDAPNRRPPSPGSRSTRSPQRSVPEINTAIAHLRDVLGDQTYESLARKGETMTTAAMATYAYDQIDQARAELNAVSK